MSLPISVNGISQSWGHISIILADTIKLTGFTAIDYADSLSEAAEAGLGLSQKPSRRSAGDYSAAETKLEGFQGDVRRLIDNLRLIAPDKRSIGVIEFQVVVAFATQSTDPVSVHTLHRTRVVGIGNSYSRGSELLKQSLTLKPLWLDRDGAVIYDATQEFSI